METNWLNPKLNNFHQNVQPGGLFNAPNLVANELTSSIDGTACPPIKLKASVSNRGSLGVRSGVPVSFYVKNVNGTGSTGYIGVANVDQMLPQDESGTAAFDWNGTATVGEEKVTVQFPAQVYFVVDDHADGKPNGDFIECHEDDNTSAAVEVNGCPSA